MFDLRLCTSGDHNHHGSIHAMRVSGPGTGMVEFGQVDRARVAYEGVMPKQIRLNAFDMNCAGHQSPGLWTHPRDQADRYNTLDYWVQLARLLERGKFDALFLADVLGIYDVYKGSPVTAWKTRCRYRSTIR
jgi:hypothetical protein